MYCSAGDILDELVSMLTGGVTDESFDADDSETALAGRTNVDQSNPLSLLELSSRIVARHCTCASLEKHNPPLDEGLLRRVAIISMLCLCI